VPKPFLKWVGGKSRVLPELVARLPKRINRYYEFFLGSGALFFHLQPQSAFLSDINQELINCYRCLQNCPDGILYHLQSYKNTAEQYYDIRNWDRDINFRLRPPVERAARFIYLNKTSYGDYRNPTIADRDVLANCSAALQGATITAHNMKFSPEVWQDIRYESDDFVYLDPPYIPLSATASFTAYNKTGFSLADHLRLRDYCQHLDGLGVKFLLSNSYTNTVLDLYKDFQIDFIQVGRAINCQGSGRGKIQEILVRNY